MGGWVARVVHQKKEGDERVEVVVVAYGGERWCDVDGRQKVAARVSILEG